MNLCVNHVTPSVNFKNEPIFTVENNGVVTNDQSTLVRQPKEDTLVKNNSNNASNTALGVIIALGILTAADFIFAGGKHIKKLFGTGKNDVQAVQKEVVPSMQELGVKFKNSMVLDSSEKPFNGKFFIQNLQGKKSVFECKDGRFQKVEVFQGDFPLETKKYIYSSNDRIISIIREPFVTDGKIEDITTYSYNIEGKIKSIKKNNRVLNKPFETNFEYNSKGELIMIRTKSLKLVNNKIVEVENKKRIFPITGKVSSFFKRVFPKT